MNWIELLRPLILILTIALLFYLLLPTSGPIWRRPLRGEALKERAFGLLGLSSLYRAQLWQDLIWHYSSQSFQGQLREASEIPVLPPYKRYGEVFHKIMVCRRDLGGPTAQAFGWLKASLAQDISFERQIHSESMTHLLQFLISLLAIWPFYFFTLKTLELSASWGLITLVLCWQLIGVILAGLCLKWLRQKIFYEVELVTAPLELMAILSQTGLSTDQVVKMAQMPDAGQFKNKTVTRLIRRAQVGVKNWQELGLSMNELLSELLKDLEFLRQQSFEKLKKKAAGLNFMAMAICVLPSFFALLSTVFRAFLIE